VGRAVSFSECGKDRGVTHADSAVLWASGKEEQEQARERVRVERRKKARRQRRLFVCPERENHSYSSQTRFLPLL
jgi:hypothetical protein